MWLCVVGAHHAVANAACNKCISDSNGKRERETHINTSPGNSSLNFLPEWRDTSAAINAAHISAWKAAMLHVAFDCGMRALTVLGPGLTKVEVTLRTGKRFGNKACVFSFGVALKFMFQCLNCLKYLQPCAPYRFVELYLPALPGSRSSQSLSDTRSFDPWTLGPCVLLQCCAKADRKHPQKQRMLRTKKWRPWKVRSNIHRLAGICENPGDHIQRLQLSSDSTGLGKHIRRIHRDAQCKRREVPSFVA